MNQQETVPRFLIGIPILAGLPAHLVDRLQHECVIRKLARNQVLFSQGEKAHSLHAVVAGRLRLMQHTIDGQDVTLSVFAPGELIGFVSVIEGSEYPGACEALDDSEVISILGNTFHDLMAAYPPLANRVIDMLVERLHDAHDRIRELAAEKVERRLARNVLRLANKVGVATPIGIRIDMPLSRQDLAELTATTLYTVSRILNDWQRAGLVEISREQVIVLRPHDLVLIAEELSPKVT